MGQARHLLSLLALLGVAIAMAAGCGSSGKGSESAGERGGQAAGPPAGASVATCEIGGVAGVGHVRVTGAECPFARGVVASWNDASACDAPAHGSRVSCSIGGLRCLGTATERGLAVSCAELGRSISFLAKRG
jgi:hypothetical protein